ncbi:hypothetical protein Ddc_12141 [Ditylenchus destructor]|nr:hypothetical protein Ddc_12141 [Ditylenchus destructor]
MSYYHSEVDSSSEEESTSLSDEWYKSPKSTDESLKSSSRSYESDRHKGFEKYHDHSCKPHLIGSLVDFQWCVFLIYGYEIDDVDYYDEECPVMEQVHWKKGFRLFSRFLKHQSGCDIGKFLSSKNHFDTVHDDTGCLRYTKDRKSRIHIHKKFHGDSQSMESEYGMSTMDVSVNEDLNFRAVITSYHGELLTAFFHTTDV